MISTPHALLVALGLALGAAPLQAQTPAHAEHHASAAAPAGAPATDWTAAEVRRIDAANARLTLRHEEIKSLNMPPMTMVFGVRAQAALDGLKPGDKVRFTAVDEGGGKLAITALERVP